MNRPKEAAYRDTVEIVKAALMGNSEKTAWLTETSRASTSNFIQDVYDKLCEIAQDAAGN